MHIHVDNAMHAVGISQQMASQDVAPCVANRNTMERLYTSTFGINGISMTIDYNPWGVNQGCAIFYCNNIGASNMLLQYRLCLQLLLQYYWGLYIAIYCYIAILYVSNMVLQYWLAMQLGIAIWVLQYIGNYCNTIYFWTGLPQAPGSRQDFFARSVQEPLARVF